MMKKLIGIAAVAVVGGGVVISSVAVGACIGWASSEIVFGGYKLIQKFKNKKSKKENKKSKRSKRSK
jgi:hypothetical protein